MKHIQYPSVYRLSVQYNWWIDIKEKGKQLPRNEKSQTTNIKQITQIPRITLGTIYTWRPWKLSNFQDPPSPVHLCPNFFHPLDFERPILKEPLPTLSSKLWSNNHTVHVNEQNPNKNRTKSRHCQIDHAFYCSI